MRLPLLVMTNYLLVIWSESFQQCQNLLAKSDSDRHSYYVIILSMPYRSIKNVLFLLYDGWKERMVPFPAARLLET